MKQRRVKLQKRPSKLDDLVYVELDTKCSCSPSIYNEYASIQFSRRYLECQGSMPISVLRQYIEQILPHSPAVQVLIYGPDGRLLDDSNRLKDISLSFSSPTISLRFSMINTITSLGHCLCSSPALSSIEKVSSSSSTSPTIICHESINRTLSTCPLVPTPPHSPLSFLSSTPTETSMPIVNLLTPPSPPHYSSFLIDNIVESNSNDPSIIDQITSEFGEICSSYPSVKPKRPRVPKKIIPKSISSDIPLDLSVKKRSTIFDSFPTQSKWLKMI